MLLYDSYIIYDTPDYTYDGNRLIVVDLDDNIYTDDHFCCIGIEMAEMNDIITSDDTSNIYLEMGLMFDNSLDLSDDIDIDMSYNLTIEDTPMILGEDFKLQVYYNGVEVLFEDRYKEDSTWINREKTNSDWTQRNKVDTTYKIRNKPWLP